MDDSKKKNSFSRSTNSQKKILNISCWCGSTYVVVRLSDIGSKTGKNAFFVFLDYFEAYIGQPRNNISWAHQCPYYQSILVTKEPIHAIFLKKYWAFFLLAVLIFFSKYFSNEINHGFHMKYHFLEILMTTLFPAQNNLSIPFCTGL